MDQRTAVRLSRIRGGRRKEVKIGERKEKLGWIRDKWLGFLLIRGGGGDEMITFDQQVDLRIFTIFTDGAE